MVDDQFVKGFDALIAELKELAPNIEKNSLRTGIHKAAQFMKEKVRDAAPQKTGRLKANIGAKRRRGNRYEVVSSVIGPFYARFVEKGHTLKRGKNTIGHVPANPFIQRTFEANKEAVVEVAKKAGVEAIQKTVAKLRAKMPKV